ncbi:MAG: DUF1987 domain-containing protein, partial [Bacteroidales bacterium]|nr:DUF1987 domain-containing protein [Bacteroidales bacterium]
KFFFIKNTIFVIKPIVMEIIRIEKTNNTPSIYIDEANMLCRIEGSSYPEDAYEVYQHVIDWLSRIVDNIDSELIVEFDYDFLNSISHKKVWQILHELKQFYKMGKQVKVVWYYDENDEDIMEAGEDLAELMNIPFELVAR